MSKLSRHVPALAAPLAAVGLIWAVSTGALRDLVWADIRKGMIDLRGLPWATRVLIWLGFTLLGVMLAALLFNDLWRAYSPLLPTATGPPNRGKLLPVALLPASLFMFSVAWAFGLAGALHAGLAIRLSVLLLYLTSAIQWTSSILGVAGPGLFSPTLLVVASAVLGVPLFFVLRARAPARPAVEFAVLLLLVLATFVPIHIQDVRSWRAFGSDSFLSKPENEFLSFLLVVAPLLLLIGVDIANFARRTAGWTTELVTERLSGRWLRVLLLLLLVWRLRDVVLEALGRIEKTSLSAELLAYAGALADPLAIALIWWLVVRGRGATPTADAVAETGEKYALPLILAFSAVQLGSFALIQIWEAVTSASLSLAPTVVVLAMHQQVISLTNLLNEEVTPYWRGGIALLALLAAVPIARRGRDRVGLALFIGIFGAVSLWSELTAPGRLLASLNRQGPEAVDLWWVLLFTLVALAWSLRGRLTAERAQRLILLVLITWLLRQTDFIENPFKPLFGLAGLGGIVFIAFGILWDVLTKGGWANVDTPRLPRASRILLYLGYILFTVTVINWVLTGHDLYILSRLTGDFALAGLQLFGRPILYAVFAVTLAAPDSTVGPEHVHT